MGTDENGRTAGSFGPERDAEERERAIQHISEGKPFLLIWMDLVDGMVRPGWTLMNVNPLAVVGVLEYLRDWALARHGPTEEQVRRMTLEVMREGLREARDCAADVLKGGTEGG